MNNKHKSLPAKYCLLASLVAGAFLSSPAMAACEGTELTACPAPINAKLPDTKAMLTWSQADRVFGFRNDYRNYQGVVFHHGKSVPLAAAEKPLTQASYQVNGLLVSMSMSVMRLNAVKF